MSDYDPDEIDLKRTEINLDRPLVPFDDWTEHQRIENRSMMLGNVLAGAIIIAALILVVITVLMR